MSVHATPTRMMPAMLPWAVFLGGMVLALVLWRDASFAHHEKQRQAFEFYFEDIASGIESRFDAHAQILRGVAGLFAASQTVERSEFRDYIEALKLPLRYPGIQGIGFAQALTPAELARHEAAVRREGFGDYQVMPQGKRDFYSAIVFLEPFDWRNQRAFGFDMYSEPVRRTAMDRAWKTGEPALTGRVILRQETERDIQPGSLLYLPIFRGHDTNASARPSGLSGWVYMPLRMHDMLNSLFASEAGLLKDRIVFHIYDGETPHAGSLLYQSQRIQHLPPGGFHLQRHLKVAGHTWLLDAHALPLFASEHENRANLMLFGMVAFTLMLSLFLAQMGRYQQQLAKANRSIERSRSELQNIYDTSGVAICLIGLDGRIAHANRNLAEIFGASLGEVLGSSYSAWVAPEDKEIAHDSLRRLLTGESTEVDVERIYQRKTGELFVGHIVGRTMFDGDGGVQGLVGVVSDVTRQRRDEAELRIAAAAFESNEAIVVTDANARVVRINRAFTDLTGYTQDEVLGCNLRILGSGRHSPEFYEVMWQDIVEKGYWQGEIWNRHKEGHVYPQWQTISAVRDENGQTTHYVGTAFDISQRVAQEAEIRNLAFYDHLTGLANRRLFEDRLKHAFAKCSRSRKLGSIIYLDLDRFKELNDRLGHAEGDHLLEMVAQRLLSKVREGDTVARLGGDEFVVLLEDLDADPAVATCIAVEIANELREILNQPYELNGQMPDDWQCTPSIGVALYSEQAESSASVLERADKALYAAKRAGRNTVRLDESEPIQGA